MLNMLKKINLLIIFIFLGALLSSFLIFDKPKSYISRLIFSHDLSLLSHSIFFSINDEIDFDMEKKENQKKSLVVLNRYIFDFVKPVFKNLDSGVAWKLLHGSVWCDGVSDIFLRLAENTNTRVLMMFLHNKDGNSPHTLNFVDFDNKVDVSTYEKKYGEGTYFPAGSEFRQMYLFDSQANYYPLTKDGQFVDINYMLNHKSEFLKYKYLDSNLNGGPSNIQLNLLENDSTVFNSNRTYDEYSNISKIAKKIVRVLPKNYLKSLYKFGIYINPELEDDYKKFLYARLEHILLNYDDALIAYSQIPVENTYYDYALFWYKKLNMPNVQNHNRDWRDHKPVLKGYHAGIPILPATGQDRTWIMHWTKFE